MNSSEHRENEKNAISLLHKHSLVFLLGIYTIYTERERRDFSVQSVFANYIFNGDKKIIRHVHTLG